MQDPAIAEHFLLQEAVSLLAHWGGVGKIASLSASDASEGFVKTAKLLAQWPDSREVQPLRLVFDRVNINQGQSTPHYLPAIALNETNLTLPYPSNSLPNLEALKEQAAEALSAFSPEDWQNPALLLMALEKFGSHISLGGGDISLYDLAKTTCAIASALPHNFQANNLQANNLCLIAGDLSGIQEFIYTIASAGALKSLRARSFYLQLVTEEIIYRLLKSLALPRSSIIYAGGGNLYVLAPAGSETNQTVRALQAAVNRWLLTDFQGKVFLALTAHDFPAQTVKGEAFSQHWEAAIQQLTQQKKQKFSTQLSTLFSPKAAFDNCKVCHRDDVKTLKPLNPLEGDSVLACSTCRNLFAFGGKLPKAKVIVRSTDQNIGSQYALPFRFSDAETIYYHCFDSPDDYSANSPTWIINSWNLKNYRQSEARSLFIGNYYAPSSATDAKGDTFVQAEELAAASTGLQRVGYLRMDVDNLGRIFVEGLGKHHNLPRLAALSRQMSYFFEIHLNSLAEKRSANLPSDARQLSNSERTKLLVIYAGGDDLFISGAWDQTVEFAFDIYQSFQAYTGYHPDITLSGGVSLGTPKYPLYQAANDAGDAEDSAKDNGRNSFSLFGEVFKWRAWLGEEQPKSLLSQGKQKFLKAEDIDYINEMAEALPPLLGVFPIADILNDQLDTQYSRNFVRNLLATAQMQELMIKQTIERARKENKPPENLQDMRYYLHLPKIAYTLARLPKSIRGEPFDKVRASLKSPYNAPYFKAIAIWIDLLNRP